ncbi:MAG: GNAT family N-acetyltransferase [Clostridiales bacterium]|jgi:GNAT superfamily N-acetyltransferase|nr:GNAT family N-acetyltransferase [Clostridiales bacterium]
MERLAYLQVEENNENHLRLLADIVTEYNREAAAEFTKKSPELAQMIIGKMGSRGRYCELAYAPQDDGKRPIIGFFWAQIDSNGKGFVREFYIKPECRLRGYGLEMYSHLEYYFIRDGAAIAWLTTNTDGGRAFWTKCGFADSGEIASFNDTQIWVKQFISIRELPLTAADEKSGICRSVLEALPDWFGIPEAIGNYVKSVREQPFWAVYDGGRAVGFIALAEHNPYTAEIDVMGIFSEYQHKGIGRLLTETAERYCRKRGKSMLLVKTIDFSHPDIFYARTRAFYLAVGFVPLQVLDGYWDENNPCLLLGKHLGEDVKITALPVGKGNINPGIINWAETWDWEVGKLVADSLRRKDFCGWETAFVAAVNGSSGPDGENAGFCSLKKTDKYGTDIGKLSPFICAVYVEPKFRGQRISEKLLLAACNYARSLGFDTVYLISNEQGLYEKYGFETFRETVTVTGRTEPIFRKVLA